MHAKCLNHYDDETQIFDPKLSNSQSAEFNFVTIRICETEWGAVSREQE